MQSTETASAQLFVNDDGTAATWLEAIAPSVRRREFARVAGLGAAVALAIWLLQFKTGSLSIGNAWVGAVAVALGVFYGWGILLQDHVRRFSFARAAYSQAQRLRRAGGWIMGGLVGTALLLGIEIYQGTLSADWWFALTTAAPLFVGVRLYLIRSEVVPTPAAARAMAYFTAQTEQKATAADGALVEKLWERRWVRYALALGLAGVAWRVGRNDTVLAAAFSLYAALLTLDLVGWLLAVFLGGALFGGIARGIAALPAAVVVILAVLIVANALQRDRG